MSRLLRRLVGEPWERIDRENREFLARPESWRFDWKVCAVLLTAAVVLTLQNYFGGSRECYRVIGWLKGVGLGGLSSRLDAAMADPATAELVGLVYWALFSFLTYVGPPCLVIWLVARERVRDYGVKLKGAFADWWIYTVMLGIMLPTLFVVSQGAGFKRTYPFYKPSPGEPLWPHFWAWEAAYFLQFVGLEFFFRGFMVHGTKHRFGFYSVFVMTVPYCMIHFGKPVPETFGAIVAGVVLGFMSLKTRSIWLGAAIHMSVALSMDFLSMWRQGLFP